MQGICARLGIHLIYCRPYAPEGKGKLERWHRTCRDQFLCELDERHISHLDDLNARLWAWLEHIYHRTAHAGLGGLTPLARYQQDVAKVRTLGPRAAQLDALFHHRIKRLVKKDGTVSYQNVRFEVPYELASQTVQLVIDPHAGTVLGIENATGNRIGSATPLDALANLDRRRRKPTGALPETPAADPKRGPNLVELAFAHFHTPPEA